MPPALRLMSMLRCVLPRHCDDGGEWSSVPGSERAKLLGKLADLIERDADRLALIEAEEVGKPIGLCEGLKYCGRLS
ncbi:succinate semialdehyde dehydrogenase [Pseudomonas putida S11]|nr:succinate semialdehyde dehydrogenase [Pseudomonas putida S11]